MKRTDKQTLTIQPIVITFEKTVDGDAELVAPQTKTAKDADKPDASGIDGETVAIVVQGLQNLANVIGHALAEKRARQQAEDRAAGASFEPPVGTDVGGGPTG